MRLAALLVPMVLGILAPGCRAPTQIVVDVKTDVACGDLRGVSVAVGTLGELETKPAAATTTYCDASGRVGSVVVVPSGAKGSEIAIRVVAGVKKSAEDCVRDAYKNGCIVARRALRFVPNADLHLAVHMGDACRDLPCLATETCVKGKCTSARIVDPALCLKPGGCGEEALPTPPGGGGNTLRAIGLGGASYDEAWRVAVDRDGNVIVAGLFEGTHDLGGGPSTSNGLDDFFVLKLDRNGKHLWSRRYGNAEKQTPPFLAVDADGNVILAGELTGTIDFGGGPLTSGGGIDIFVAKLDRNGAHVVSRRYGGAGRQRPRRVAVDSKGAIAVCGTFDAPFDFGGAPFVDRGSQDAFVAVLGPDLSFRWSRQITATDADSADGIAFDGAGNLVLGGHVTGVADLGAGDRGDVSARRAFLAKYGPTGAHLWGTVFDGSLAAVVDLAIDSSDGIATLVYVAGSVNLGGGEVSAVGEEADLVVGRFDADGKHRFTRAIGGNAKLEENDFDGALAIDAAGNTLVTSFFEGLGAANLGGTLVTTDGGFRDAFVLKLDRTGATTWLRVLRGNDHQTARAIATSPSSSVFVVGGNSGIMDVGTTKLVANETDLFVLELAP